MKHFTLSLVKIKYVICIPLIFLSITVFGQNNSLSKESVNISSGNITDTIQLIENLIDSADILLKKDDSNTAINYLEKALILAELDNHERFNAQILVKIAKIYENTADYKNALIFCKQALHFSEHANYKDLLGHIYTSLSNIWWRTGDNQIAIEYGLKSVKLFEELLDTSNTINSNNILAGVYTDMGNLDKAEEIYDKMLNLAIQKNDSVLIATNLEYKGVVYFYRKDFKNAIEYYTKSLNINVKLNNKLKIGINYGNMAEAFEGLNLHNQALSYYFKALKIEEEFKFNSGLIFIYYGIGQTYSKMNSWAKAEEYFNKSLNLIEEYGVDREKPIIYELISSHYNRKGDYKNAYKYFKEYSYSKNLLFNIEKNKQIENIRIKYELGKKEQENLILIQKNESKEKQIEANQNLIKLQYIIGSIILLGLILSIIFTIVFFKGKQKLKETNKVKDKLFSLIGHDLRGPIGTNKEMLNLLLQDHILNDTEKLRKYLSSIQKSMSSTFDLLEEILIWSKADQNIINYNPTRIHLNKMVESTFNLLENSAQNKSIKLINDLQKDMYIYADQNLLLTVLRNIISNSVKFTKPQGYIKVSAKTVDSIETKPSKKDLFPIKVSISDNGVGIKKDDLSKLFDKKSFFSTFGTGNEKGTGLGLILCKEFVQINGGKIWVESEEAKGSVFHFTIPSDDSNI